MTPEEREALKQSVKDDLEVRETVKEAEREWKQEHGKTVGQRIQKTAQKVPWNDINKVGVAASESFMKAAFIIVVIGVIVSIGMIVSKCQGAP